jgi:DNA-binding CsgD family transcriptional regulator
MKKSMKAVKLIAQGYTIDETADILCVSRSSVEKYLRVERIRLKCRTLAHLVHVVTRDGLICLLIVTLAASSTNTYRRVSRPYRREQTIGVQIT